MGTRLTRVTRELSSRDPDKALRQASARVLDWSGGTRLGECLTRFNDEWGVRGNPPGQEQEEREQSPDHRSSQGQRELVARHDHQAAHAHAANPAFSGRSRISRK